MRNLRLDRHFDAVLSVLAVDGALRRPQRRRRARALATLHAYRTKGRYPTNDRFAIRTPFFVDRSETPCAMAALIAASGSRDLVERIATNRNHAYISDLADDEELLAWLDAHGMTASEAALVQPGYGPCFGGPGNDHYDEVACVAEHDQQWDSAAKSFCAGAPFRSVRRVVAVDGDHARVVASWPPGVADTTMDVASSVAAGTEFLVGSVDGAWSTLALQVANQIAYRPPSGGASGLLLLAVPVSDIGAVLTSNDCAASVKAIVVKHPEVTQSASALWIAAQQARTSAPPAPPPPPPTVDAGRAPPADNPKRAQCGCDLAARPSNTGAFGLLLAAVALIRRIVRPR